MKDIFKSARTRYFKFNQREMSRLLSKGQSVYAKYETGEVAPSSSTMIHLMNQLIEQFGYQAIIDILFRDNQTKPVVEPEILMMQHALLQFAGSNQSETRKHIQFMLQHLEQKENK